MSIAYLQITPNFFDFETLLLLIKAYTKSLYPYFVLHLSVLYPIKIRKSMEWDG